MAAQMHEVAAALVERIRKCLCRQPPPLLESKCQKEAETELHSLPYVDFSNELVGIRDEIESAEDAILQPRSGLEEVSDLPSGKFKNPELLADDLERTEAER